MGGSRAGDTVTFVAELTGVWRRGLTEIEATSRDMDHSVMVSVPEWSHEPFRLGERICVTVSRLEPPDAPEGRSEAL